MHASYPGVEAKGYQRNTRKVRGPKLVGAASCSSNRSEGAWLVVQSYAHAYSDGCAYPVAVCFQVLAAVHMPSAGKDFRKGARSLWIAIGWIGRFS
jgi:hypothetical protein